MKWKNTRSSGKTLGVAPLLLTAAVAVVPLKTTENWRNNKHSILQMAIERNYFITMHHQAGVNFENLTEVKFRDILLTGTDV